MGECHKGLTWEGSLQSLFLGTGDSAIDVGMDRDVCRPVVVIVRWEGGKKDQSFLTLTTAIRFCGDQSRRARLP